MEAITMDKINEKMQLRETIRLLERKLGLLSDNEMSCCNITMAQCHAIVEIGRAKNISLIDLSSLLNLDNSTLSRTVNNLVKSGLVQRELDAQDRRYVTITLTENGLKIFNGIECDMDSHYSEIYECIPEDKRDQVLESLQILIDVFNKCNCC
jgi:DNA-binding MarR family transcriptional regulator